MPLELTSLAFHMTEIIRGLHNIKPQHNGCVATIGNFDGLHLGHQKVMAQLKEKARQLKLPTTVITFEPLPQEYFQQGEAPARLLCFREKVQILQDLGIDRVVCLRFDKKLASLPAEKFVTDILVDKLGIKWLIVGDDFHFGHQRHGDFYLLTELGQRYGFMVSNTHTVEIEKHRVGSSAVRTALADGNFSLAKQLLGRLYSISGRVIYGDSRGRELGFPTANIPLKRRILPLHGVYAVWVRGLGPNPLPAVANIGNRPTVDGKRSLLEVYLLDFNEPIYGRFLQIEFLQKLRDEQRFGSFDELKEQIGKDVAQAKAFFNK